jgi:hypothetical protein
MGRSLKTLIGKISAAGSKCGGVVLGQCKAGAAKLSMKDIGSKVIFRYEGTRANTKMCDCVIFAEMAKALLIAVVEFKSKTIEAKAVLAQLQSCARIAEQILGVVDFQGLDIRFGAIVLAKGFHSSEVKVLQAKSVTFQNTRRRIITKSCGSGRGLPLSGLAKLFS